MIASIVMLCGTLLSDIRVSQKPGSYERNDEAARQSIIKSRG